MDTQIRLQGGKIADITSHRNIGNLQDFFYEYHTTNKTEGKMDQSIYNELSSYIATNILKQPNRVISIDEPLISSGLIDSFSRVDLSLFVEDNYGVIIDEKELSAEHLDTLDKFINLIEVRRK